MCCDGDSACKVLGSGTWGRQRTGGQSDLNLKCCSRCSDGDLLLAVARLPTSTFCQGGAVRDVYGLCQGVHYLRLYRTHVNIQ